MGALLNALCLKPNLPLQRQLTRAFGITSFLGFLILVALACTSINLAGNTVKKQVDDVLHTQVVGNLANASQLSRDRFSLWMDKIEASLTLLESAIQDRMMGYPMLGWEEDLAVPFRDVETGTNKYPLACPLIPLDWNITYVNPDQAEENMQEKSDWLNLFPRISTDSPSYFMQGTCNPLVHDSSENGYYENCTLANNDHNTGGVVQPTQVNKYLHEKVSDLSPVLKAMYEASPVVLLINIWFHNQGAGSVVTYPAFERESRFAPYKSLGCEWMSTTNNMTGKAYGTEEEINRCHAAGATVPQREFNPNELDIFQYFALNPNEVGWYRSVVTPEGYGTRMLIVGKPVFDRLTGELIGVVTFSLSIDTLNEALLTYQIHNTSSLWLVEFEDGKVVADSEGKALAAGTVDVNITDLRVMTEWTFTKLQTTVDFGEEWTRAGVDEAFQKNIIYCIAGLVAAQPLPAPPREYDPSYRPNWLVIHVMSYEVFDVIDSLDRSVASDALQVGLVTTAMGFCGMLLVLAIIWCVSRMLSQPLLWMESVAWGIVNHNRESGTQALHGHADKPSSATMRCTPKTEITELLDAFLIMIKGFSRSGAPKVASPEPNEIHNDLTWRSDFQQLYLYIPEPPQKKRSCSTSATEPTDSDNSSQPNPAKPNAWQNVPPGRNENRALVDTSKAYEDLSLALVVPAPPKKNKHRNILANSLPPNETSLKGSFVDKSARVVRSALFWWILGLIVLPMVITNALICADVTKRIMGTVPKWVGIAEKSSYALQMQMLEKTVAVKADTIGSSFHDITRDLHILTRTGAWLLFNGIMRSESFTDLLQATEECKGYLNPPDYEMCPYTYQHVACPCNSTTSQEIQGQQCVMLNKTDPRYLQQNFFVAQARDANPITGNRPKSLSYPKFDHSANTTLWWSNISAIPGAEEGANASGYATAYDRLRVSSAMPIVTFPIYNHADRIRRPQELFGIYLSFEADGLFTGYSGCVYGFPYLSHSVVTKENKPVNAPVELCPIGKYGYDPRCRDWYVAGREVYRSKNTSLYVSAPYHESEYSSTGATVTSPIVNPSTGEYLGQASLDFHPIRILDSLEGLNVPLFFVVTPEDGPTGANTVVSSKDSTKWKPAALTDVALEFDGPTSPNRMLFESKVLPTLQKGETGGIVRFNRTKQNGSREEILVQYMPVYTRVLQAVDPSDFRRGVYVSSMHVYTVGIGVLEEALMEPYQSIAFQVHCDLRRIQRVYIGAAVVVSFLFAVFICIISWEVTKPVITLLEIVRAINAGDVKDEIISLSGGSREAYRVYNSFSKLYKVVRISNVAFFTGNLNWAYHFIDDALKLFRKVGDKKAIGVACNNLGATLYAMSHAATDRGVVEFEDGAIACDVARRHFDESIQIAVDAFENASCAEEKAAHAQPLADRLFNRSIFLLSLSMYSNSIDDPIKKQAIEDLARARELDEDVRDYWLQHKLLLKNSDIYFDRVVRRIHGLVHYYDDDEIRRVWDPKELVEDCDQFLFTAWSEPTAPLFDVLTPIGRLQQLESAAIRVDLCQGRKVEAARLAMRLFAEDEFAMECAFVSASKAVLDLARSKEANWCPKTRSSIKADVRRMLKFCKYLTVDVGKCLVFAIEVNEMLEGSPLLERVNKNCLKMYKKCFESDDYVGIVAYTTKGDLNVPLGMKEDYEGRQLAMLDMATTATSDTTAPAFPYAFQMIVDAIASNENDSFILLISDGDSWDPVLSASIRAQIERINKERVTSIHVIVVGLEIDDEEILEECKHMSKVSRLSRYIPLTMENADKVFESIGDTVCGRGEPSSCMLGITMEKF